MSDDIQEYIDHVEEQIAQLTRQNQYKEAIILATTLLDVVRQKLGEQSASFAAVLDNLAFLYYITGEYRKAVRLLEQAVIIKRFVLGEEHRGVAGSMNDLAVIYNDLGEYGKAEPLYQQALAIRRAKLGEQHPDVAQSLNNLALFYKGKGNYHLAEPLYQQALNIWRATLGEQHPEVATGLNNLAALYDDLGEYGKAEPLYQQAFEINRASLGEQHPDVAISLNNLATLYHRMGEYRKAEPFYQQALTLGRTVLGDQHLDIAGALNNLALLYDDMGELRQAESLYQQALTIRQSALGEQHREVAQSLHNLAGLYKHIGEYRKAELLYQQALTIRRTVLDEQHSDIALSLNDLAVLYDDMGEYSKAEPLFIQALAIKRAAFGEKHPDVATSLNNLAELYNDMGDYDKAEPLYQQSLAIRRAMLGEKHPYVATSLNNLASLYNDRGEYREAAALYQQALDIVESVPGDQQKATYLSNLSGLYYDMGEYDKAGQVLEQALAITRAVLGERHPDMAGRLNNLALLYKHTGEPSKAQPLLEQALTISRAVLGEQHPSVAIYLGNLASVRVVLGFEADGFNLLQQALAIEDQIMSQVFSAGSERRRLAFLATQQTNLEHFLSLVLQFFSTVPERVQAVMDVILRRKGITAEILAAQREALLGGRYPGLASELDQLRVLRTQITRKTLAGPGKESPEEYQQLLSEWNTQKEQLETTLARNIPEVNLVRQLLQVNRQVISNTLPNNALLVEFVRFVPFDFRAVPVRGEHLWQPARYIALVLSSQNPSQVQLIDLGEAKRIDDLIAAYRSFLTSEQEADAGSEAEPLVDEAPPSHEKPESELKRDLLIERDMPDEGHASLSGRQLREAVFDPLLPHLHGNRQLFLAPDGNLNRLPFEVLPAEDGTRLIDHFRISYVSVGRDLLRFTAASNRQAQAPLVMADPDFDLTASMPESPVEVPEGRRSTDMAKYSLAFRPLPGTRQEGEQIAQMLGVPGKFGKQATVASLKALPSPRILHLATHGFFLSDRQRDPGEKPSSGRNPPRIMKSDEGRDTRNRLTWLMSQHLENPLLRSGLAFAGANTWNRGGMLPPEAEDGLLTAEDVSGLDLLDTELVVLSACETGLGSVQVGEGVFGLRRTFMLAGAKTLMMSLWKVPDRQTQELMGDFYQRLLTGQPRAEALRGAQLAIKEKYPHPRFWGAFICQGNPGPLL